MMMREIGSGVAAHFRFAESPAHSTNLRGDGGNCRRHSSSKTGELSAATSLHIPGISVTGCQKLISQFGTHRELRSYLFQEIRTELSKMFNIIAVLIALGILMYLAFRGISLLILAPAMAMLAVLLTGDLPILASYTQIFMTNLVISSSRFFRCLCWELSSAS
jgi:hypothetical protein